MPFHLWTKVGGNCYEAQWHIPTTTQVYSCLWLRMATWTNVEYGINCSPYRQKSTWYSLEWLMSAEHVYVVDLLLLFVPSECIHTILTIVRVTAFVSHAELSPQKISTSVTFSSRRNFITHFYSTAIDILLSAMFVYISAHASSTSWRPRDELYYFRPK